MTQGIVAVHTRRVVVRAGVGDGVIVGWLTDVGSMERRFTI